MQTKTLSQALAACGSPDTIIAAILQHYPDLRAPVQIEPIARDAGIADIGDLEEKGIVCTSLSDMTKTKGAILCAVGLAPQRRRFASAHALGHFLIKAHRGDRHCTNRDLGEKRTDTPQRKEEMQANRFAAGLDRGNLCAVPAQLGLDTLVQFAGHFRNAPEIRTSHAKHSD